MVEESPSKKIKVLYWIFTGLLTAQMLMSAGMYLFKYDMVHEAFTHLGYPVYIIYPLAVAKFLGLAAVLSNMSRFLKQLAYAGFFYNLLLAVSAHISAGDGPETIPAVLALVWLFAPSVSLSPCVCSCLIVCFCLSVSV